MSAPKFILRNVIQFLPDYMMMTTKTVLTFSVAEQIINEQ